MSKKQPLTRKQKRLLKKRRRRRILFGIEIFILLILIAGVFIYAKLGKMNFTSLDFSKIGVNSGVSNNKVMKGYTTIGLVGLDNRSNKLKSGNSDTMIIASIDNDTKKVKLVSVYRDTYLRIGEDSEGNGQYNRANAAYAKGGAEQFLNMLNTNLDLNVTDFVSVDFQAVAEAVELLGGIDVELKEEEKMLQVEETSGTAGNDFRRAARQREVIYKIVEKAKNADVATLSKILDKVFPNIYTSFSKAEILQMGMSMLSYDIEDQTGFPFDHLYGQRVKDAVGIDVVLPVTLESNVIKLHEFLYPEDSYTPSEEVKAYSQRIVDKSGFGEESRLDHSEDGSLAAYRESDTE